VQDAISALTDRDPTKGSEIKCEGAHGKNPRSNTDDEEACPASDGRERVDHLLLNKTTARCCPPEKKGRQRRESSNIEK